MRYLLSIPERLFRALAAVLGGLLYELTQVLLPTGLRRSRLYHIVDRLLRITVELVGDVQGVFPAEKIDTRELAARKVAGNVIETASFIAVGWSPLWLLAAAADLTGGTQIYLRTLIAELKEKNLLPVDTDVSSAEELLQSLESTSGMMADIVDIPPLNVTEMRQSWTRLKENAGEIPSTSRLAALYSELEKIAKQEDQSVASVSSVVAHSAMQAGIQIGNTYIFDYYRRAFDAIHDEGLAVYSSRVIKPYLQAAITHLNPHRQTSTEKLLTRNLNKRKGG
jgi:hypothetical protein